MDRRQFLLTTAVAPFVGLVSLTGGVRGNTDNPAGVVRLWYDAVDKQNPEIVDAAVHSESDRKLDDEDEQSNEDENGDAGLTAETMVRVNSTEILKEGLNESELGGRLLWTHIDDETISDLAATENALVGVEVSYERLTEERIEENEHIVAMEDGDWQLVL